MYYVTVQSGSHLWSVTLGRTRASSATCLGLVRSFPPFLHMYFFLLSLSEFSVCLCHLASFLVSYYTILCLAYPVSCRVSDEVATLVGDIGADSVLVSVLPFPPHFFVFL